jgi:hypothetical protein
MPSRRSRTCRISAILVDLGLFVLSRYLVPQAVQNCLIRNQVEFVYRADLMEKTKLSAPSLQAHAVPPDSCAPHCSFSKALNLLFQLGLGLSLCRSHLSLAHLST